MKKNLSLGLHNENILLLGTYWRHFKRDMLAIRDHHSTWNKTNCIHLPALQSIRTASTLLEAPILKAMWFSPLHLHYRKLLLSITALKITYLPPFLPWYHFSVFHLIFSNLRKREKITFALLPWRINLIIL